MDISQLATIAQMAYYTVAGAGGLYFIHTRIARNYIQAAQTQRFIKKLKDNHLPHIDTTLQQLCKGLGVDYKPLPLDADDE